jgi:hypothetical protein
VQTDSTIDIGLIEELTNFLRVVQIIGLSSLRGGFLLHRTSPMSSRSSSKSSTVILGGPTLLVLFLLSEERDLEHVAVGRGPATENIGL